MESPNLEQQPGLKRKRSPVPGAVADEGRPVAAAGGGPKGVGNVTQINYLVRAKAERLRLIEGDGETFGDVLGMIDDYEGTWEKIGHGICLEEVSPFFHLRSQCLFCRLFLPAS